jgi:hypothetical protein
MNSSSSRLHRFLPRMAPLPPAVSGAWALGLVCLVVAAGGAGCAKARAETMPDGPPLAVPAPPPRVFAPVDETRAAVPPEAEPPAPVVEPPAPAPPARRSVQRGDADSRAEVPAAAPPAPSAPEPPRELRPAGSAAGAELERKVRDLLARAARDLGRVDYRQLSAEGKQQYDQSKRFADQAEEEVKKRNFVYAETLADKAATLATQLPGR